MSSCSFVAQLGEFVASDLERFVSMGCKGVYIWPSYGLTALILTGIVITAWRSEKVVRRRIAQQLKREERGLK